MVVKETTRKRMQKSNDLAIDYLLNKLNANQVWLKPHYKFTTKVYCQDHSYSTQDIYSLFDGLCSWKRMLYGIQVKTNAWDVIKKHTAFQQDWARNLPILFINVDSETGEVKHREFFPDGLKISKV